MRLLDCGLIAFAIGMPLATSAAGGNEPNDGFTLFHPIPSETTYLIDLNGDIVHSWEAAERPGMSVYLTDDLTLVRTQKTGSGPAGYGGVIEKVAWDGTVTWSWQYAEPGVYLQHHDIEPLPNGNVLLIAWDFKTDREAYEQGRDPAILGNGTFLPDSIIEVQPTGATSGAIVWEWHAWDHLVQDFDPTLPNYGVVADHPELIDLNFPRQLSANDWNHFNSVDYHEGFDQILISVHHFSELWVIDHSTTTAEAAGHTGGNSGKGGDLLYRWGNPQAYDHGGPADQLEYLQHDATWVSRGYPGEGNILVFNNGDGRPAGDYSTVDEITPPVDAQGNYAYTPGTAFGPAGLTWTYVAPVPTDFYSPRISGCERQRNGNTLICSGGQAWFFEVNGAGELLWEHHNTLPAGAQKQVFKVRRYDLCKTPVNECLSSPNSMGPGAFIGYGGTNSVTANDLVLQVTGAAAGQAGIFMFGADSVQVPFGDGWRCVGGSGGRLPVVQTDGTGTVAYALDLSSAPLSGYGINEFDLYRFQFWYRDPSYGSANFNLSDALQVRFCP